MADNRRQYNGELGINADTFNVQVTEYSRLPREVQVSIDKFISPERGVDYWTMQDQQYIIDQVISRIPQQEEGLVDGYLYNGAFYKEPEHQTLIQGETGKIYVELVTNKTYRWQRGSYIEISPSLTIGETSDTAFAGNRGVALESQIVDKYEKPSEGIPYSDLDSGVTNLLDKANTALQSETDPTVPSWAKQQNKPSYNYSEIGNTPDLSGFITKTVDDLTNYYLKSDTYTKTEVQNLITAIHQFRYEIYATLPQTGESNVLYLIGPTGSGSDKYEEYVYANNVFVKIGDTSIDLTGYIQQSDLNTALANYTPTSQLAAVATSGSYNDLSDKPQIELVEMFYGESNAWTKFINAYTAKCVVYCRASSNSNPASGSKTRKAFMAYVNNEDNPTEVEFQYYRSVTTHSDNQQGDQVFVYKLTSANGGTWTVTTRNAFTKVVAGANMSSSYSNGTITLDASVPTIIFRQW